MSNTLTLNQTIRYTINGDVTIDDVLQSLEGLKYILQQSPHILRMYNCGKIKVSSQIECIQEGSLENNFLVKLVFGSEEEMNKWIQLIRAKTGIDTMMRRTPILTGIIGLAIGLGGTYIVQRCLSSDGITIHASGSAMPILIQGSNNTLHLPHSNETIEAQAKKYFYKKQMAKAVHKFIHPIKAHGNQGDILVNDQELSLPKDFIHKLPENIAFLDDIQEESFENAEINVRALNLDSEDKGWKCIVLGVNNEQRFPMILEERETALKINPGYIQHANFTFEYIVNRRGKKIYKRVILHDIISPK